MKVLLRIIAVLCVAIAAFLIFAVINAVASDEGARAGVAVAYVAGSIALAAVAAALWRTSARRGRPAA